MVTEAYDTLAPSLPHLVYAEGGEPPLSESTGLTAYQFSTPYCLGDKHCKESGEVGPVDAFVFHTQNLLYSPSQKSFSQTSHICVRTSPLLDSMMSK